MKTEYTKAFEKVTKNSYTVYECDKYSICSYQPNRFELYDKKLGEFLPGVFRTESDARRFAERLGL